MRAFILLIITLICVYSYGKDYSAKNGDWEISSTWSKGVEPTTEDTLIIGNGDTVAISSNLFYNTVVVIMLDGGILEFTGKLNLLSGSTIKSNGGKIISSGGGNSDKIQINGVGIWSGNMGDLEGDFSVVEEGVLPVRWG